MSISSVPKDLGFTLTQEQYDNLALDFKKHLNLFRSVQDYTSKELKPGQEFKASSLFEYLHEKARESKEGQLISYKDRTDRMNPLQKLKWKNIMTAETVLMLEELAGPSTFEITWRERESRDITCKAKVSSSQQRKSGMLGI